MDKQFIFAWGEAKDSPEFEIRAASKSETKDLLASCEIKKVWNQKKNENILNRYDVVKYNSLIYKKCILGWKNLKNKHLLEIFDTQPPRNNWQFFKAEKGQQKSDIEIPFTPENLELLTNHYSPGFTQFFDYCQELIEDHFKKTKADELKN